MRYQDYSGAPGVRRFAEIAEGFDFGPRLPPASFPPSFVQAYIAQLDHPPELDDHDHFLARYGTERRLFWLEGLDDPAHIHSQNAILSDSHYAPQGARILPAGLYSFGTAMDDTARYQLMVDLDPSRPTHGQIWLWRRAWEPRGQGDNNAPLGFVAKDLPAFWTGLAPEARLLEQLRSG